MWADLNHELVPHAGERGRAREEVLREFLRKHLPQSVGVSSGFVFDSHGHVSRQVDLVVYDRLFSPWFRVAGDTELFPVESVLCVGEVKSALRSKQDLDTAFEVLQSVKSLDRTAGGRNVTLPAGQAVDQQANHLDQVFTFVFAVTATLSPETVRDTLAQHIDYATRHLWPNLVFIYDRCVVTYACAHGICPNPMDAQAIGIISDEPRERLLMEFFVRLAMAVQATNVVSFAYADYVGKAAFSGGTTYVFNDVPADQQERLRRKWEQGDGGA